MAEARNAFRTLVKEAPEKLQLRIQQLLDSLVFKDELSTTKTELEAGQADQGTYVHIASADTITAKHTFAPASATAPFALGSNALAQLVTGLNADYLDSQHGSFYQNASNINAGTLAVSYGGTGLNSLAAGLIPYGAGTSAFGSAATFIYSSGKLGIGTAGPDRTLDVLHAADPQIRLTQADGTVYTDLQTDSSGYFNITPSGTRATLTGSLIATKTITSADTGGTRHFSFTANSNTDPAASAEVNAGYFAYNKTAGSNGTYIVNALEGVYRSQYADESSTGRGVYGRFYIDPASSATLRTGIGIECSARASYGGGTEIAAEAGTAFVGERIWMAPYFSAATVDNVNNFWGLWIYGEHTSQRNADAAIKIGDAGGGWAELINGTNPTGPGFTLGATLNNATGDEVAFTLNSTTNKLTSGDDTLLQLVQTDTASPGTSYLINAKVATASKFSVLNTGVGTFAGSLTIGSSEAATDYTLTFDGETNDGLITWMEDEDYFKFSDCVRTEGGRKINTTTQVDTYIVLATDELVVCNKAAAFTVTLPVASGSGRKVYIQNINTGTVTLEGDTADTIDGNLNISILQWESAQVVDYAANKWVIV